LPGRAPTTTVRDVKTHANVFAAERARHLVFFGRQDLFAHIDHLLCENAKWIVLEGSPGSGKGAIVSNYLLRLETAGVGEHLHWLKSWLRDGTRDKSPLGSLAQKLVTVRSDKGHRVVPQHFIKYGFQDWAVASAIEASLVEQVGYLFPKLVDPKDTSTQRLPRLLLRASADVLVPHDRRLVLVVSGLDQVEGDWSTNPVFEFLPVDLPDGVSIVCTTRPVAADLLPLDWTSPVRLDLDSPEWAESSFAVQMAMLKEHQTQIGRAADYVNDAVKYADANLRYLHELLSWKAEYPRAAIDKTPPKFLAYLDELWQLVNRFDGHRRDVLRAGLRSFVDGDRWVAEKDIGDGSVWTEPDDARAFYKSAMPLLLTKHDDDGVSHRVFHRSFGGFVAAKQRDADVLTMLKTAMPVAVSLPLGTAPGKAPSVETKVVKRYGLVIGVGNYVETGLALRYSGNDARAISDTLTKLGYAIVSLTDADPSEARRPTLANLRGTFAGLKGRFDEKELVLVYFAGHGALVDGKPYLLARDSRTEDLANTALPLADVERYMRDSGSRRLILVVDACHAGVDIGREGGPMVGTGLDPAVIHNALELGEGFVVLAGSSKAQRAQDDDATQHGVYTFCFLQGLSGKADIATPPKGFVTVDDLRDYVLACVRTWCFENMADLQLPTARIEGVGDMIVAYTAAPAQKG
jgi:hypothetical protein